MIKKEFKWLLHDFCMVGAMLDRTLLIERKSQTQRMLRAENQGSQNEIAGLPRQEVMEESSGGGIRIKFNQLLATGKEKYNAII